MTGKEDKKSAGAATLEPEAKHPEQEHAEREEEKAKDQHAEGKPASTEAQRPAGSAGEGRSEEDAPALSEEAPSSKQFPVVGIGASAGGIEALEKFFENMPRRTGMALVVVTHTDPKHSSLLPDILRRKAKPTVKEVADGMPVEPDTIYLPPSDRDPVIEDDHFRLEKRPESQIRHMPIDRFFRSLAGARGDRAACVILSGTGTDGTQGIRSVKEKSGLVVVQAPESARHPGMPNSAIESGLADGVLPPAEMAERLVHYFKSFPEFKPDMGETRKKQTDPLQKILRFLASRTRHDFSHYKPGTLKRRIARRIVVTRSEDAGQYLERLKGDDDEIRILFQDLLIGVTNFFRDPNAFEYLKNKVLPGLLSRTEEGDIIRVWVPGCATGEEAFSVAIVLKETMEECETPREIQIFGTDLDPRAIEKAREGTYLPNIAADVSENRLKRFFVKSDDRYRVKREIREPVVFAEQNVLRDPPFSDLDLLVCRNLLIYLRTSAQDRLLPIFHYTLKSGGILFLGSSETTGRFPNLFEPLSKTHSIYRKKQAAVQPHVHFPLGKTRLNLPGGETEDGKRSNGKNAPSLESVVEGLLYDEYTPAAVAVDDEGDILFTHGRTGKYLELTPGRPVLNISDMARKGLRFSLQRSLRKVKEGRERAEEKGIRVRTNGGHQFVDLTVRRIERAHLQRLFLAVFKDVPDPAEAKDSKAAGSKEGGDDRDRIEALESELSRVRQDYRSAVEELETSNEELRSTNEEIQSSNEELQSTNEELESSREELQSLNEELSTVNSELQNKIEDLDEAYRDITNVLNSTRIAIVFLDTEMKVTRFTDEASRLVNLIDSDIGRPMSHISTNLKSFDLAEKARQVLESLRAYEGEVETADGHWYRLNILVHRKEEHLIEGVVLTFVNIDSQKKAEQENGNRGG